MVQASGARAFINKPFLSEQVLRVVNRVLQGEQAWN
jgi:FixJ family two-component response regulator